MMMMPIIDDHRYLAGSSDCQREVEVWLGFAWGRGEGVGWMCSQALLKTSDANGREKRIEGTSVYPE